MEWNSHLFTMIKGRNTVSKVISKSIDGVEYKYFPRVIPSKQYGVITRDFDMVWPPDEDWPNGITRVSRVTRNKLGPNYDVLRKGIWGSGLPATERNVEDIVIDLDEKLQFHIHNTSSKRAEISPTSSLAKSSFGSFTRGNSYAFDFAGSNTNHDYINNTNTDKDNIKNKVMLTSGAVFEIIGSEVYKSIDCWVIKAINVLTEDVEKYTDLDITMGYSPTISRRERIMNTDGSWTGLYHEDKVIPFPQYNEKAWMFNYSKTGRLYIHKNRCQLIESLDERPEIYVR